MRSHLGTSNNGVIWRLKKNLDSFNLPNQIPLSHPSWQEKRLNPLQKCEKILIEQVSQYSLLVMLTCSWYSLRRETLASSR